MPRMPASASTIPAVAGAQKAKPSRAARGTRTPRMASATPAPLSPWYTAASAKIA